MAREPADYNEWHSRRNGMAMTLCSAVYRANGGVCSCYNGDEEPDRVHFEHCRRMVATINEALEKVLVPIPEKPAEKPRRAHRR